MKRILSTTLGKVIVFAAAAAAIAEGRELWNNRSKAETTAPASQDRRGRRLPARRRQSHRRRPGQGARVRHRRELHHAAGPRPRRRHRGLPRPEMSDHRRSGQPSEGQRFQPRQDHSRQGADDDLQRPPTVGCGQRRSEVTPSPAAAAIPAAASTSESIMVWYILLTSLAFIAGVIYSAYKPTDAALLRGQIERASARLKPAAGPESPPPGPSSLPATESTPRPSRRRNGAGSNAATSPATPNPEPSDNGIGETVGAGVE